MFDSHEVLDLVSEYVLDFGLLRVHRIRLGAELNDRLRAQQNERNVKQKRADKRVPHAHRMHRDDQQIEAELGASLDGDGDQVEAKGRESRHPEEGKGVIELNEKVVQKRTHGGVDQYVQNHVDNP